MHFPAVRVHLPKDSSYEGVIGFLSVDKSEYGVDTLLGCFFYHLRSILVGKAPEGLGSELEQGLDELDRNMVVEESETCQVYKFLRNRQLSSCGRPVDEYKFHSDFLALDKVVLL